MPTVDFGACLSNYWFVWSINGVGSIFGLVINMIVSYFFMKYFHNMSKPKAKKPKRDIPNRRETSPVTDIQPEIWSNEMMMMGNPYYMSEA